MDGGKENLPEITAPTSAVISGGRDLPAVCGLREAGYGCRTERPWPTQSNRAVWPPVERKCGPIMRGGASCCLDLRLPQGCRRGQVLSQQVSVKLLHEFR